MARDRTYKPPTNTKKYQATQEYIDEIREDARKAQELLDNPYLITYLTNVKQSILEINAKQLVNDYTETTETNGIKNTVSVPSRKEYTLLAGEYRFVDKFISDLEQTVKIGKETNEKIKSEEIEVLADDSE